MINVTEKSRAWAPRMQWEKSKEGGPQRILGTGCSAEGCLPSTMLILTVGLETEPSLPCASKALETTGSVGGRALGLPGAHTWDTAGSGWGGDPSGAQQGPQSSSLSSFLERQAQHRSWGAPVSETRAGLWIRPPSPGMWGTAPQGLQAVLVEKPASRGITTPSPLLSGPGAWV